MSCQENTVLSNEGRKLGFILHKAGGFMCCLVKGEASFVSYERKLVLFGNEERPFWSNFQYLTWCYFVCRENCYALLSIRGGLIGARGEKSIFGEFWKRAARSWPSPFFTQWPYTRKAQLSMTWNRERGKECYIVT